jgi:hypothetical protein
MRDQVLSRFDKRDSLNRERAYKRKVSCVRSDSCHRQIATTSAGLPCKRELSACYYPSRVSKIDCTPLAGAFLCGLTCVTGKLRQRQRYYPVSRSFTRDFSLLLIEFRLYTISGRFPVRFDSCHRQIATTSAGLPCKRELYACYYPSRVSKIDCTP